jgi:hypothetical protein
MKQCEKLRLANGKYYTYLVDCITEKTMILKTISSSHQEIIWFTFYFDYNGDNHTSYRGGDSNKCNIFHKINATKRICAFLVRDGLKPEEIGRVIDLIKQRWEKKYGICFPDTNYGLPYEYTKYKWEN